MQPILIPLISLLVGMVGSAIGVVIGMKLGVVRLLEHRGYIVPVGRAPGPGQATLYGTTDAFLEKIVMPRSLSCSIQSVVVSPS